MFLNYFMENITSAVNKPTCGYFEPFKQSTIYCSSFIILLLLTQWICKIKQQKKDGNRRKIPRVSLCPIKIPFLHAWYHPFKLRNGGVQALEDIVREHGSIFEVSFGKITFIGVTDTLVIKKILTSTNASHLNKPRYIYAKIFENLLSNGLVAVDYPTWSFHRKVANQAFTLKSLKMYLKIMNQHANCLVNKIHEKFSGKSTQEEVVIHDVSDLIDFHILGTIAEVLWGHTCYSDEGNLDIQQSIHRAKEITIYRFTHPEFFTDFLWNLHPKKFELDRIWGMLTKTLQLNIEKLKSKRYRSDSLEPAEFPDPNNMKLGGNVQHDDDNGQKRVRSPMEEMIYAGMSDGEIYSEIATFLLAGFETTSVSINMLLFHLASNPDIQSKCQDELDHLISSKQSANSDFVFTMEDLTNLKYLERCIFETLRLTAVIPAFSRRLDAPLKVSEDLQFEAGQAILVLPWVLHRDHKHFPNPMKFSPDRFLPENSKGRDPYSFIPFSAGTRNCIGKKFGLMQIKVLAALILRNYEISTGDRLDSIKFYFEASLRPERNIKMTLKKRKFTEGLINTMNGN